MTTIAYARGQIAADTGMCVGDARLGETRKITRSSKGLCGGAGNAGWVAQFLTWFEKGERGHAPEPDSTSDYTDRAIIIRPSASKIIEVWESEGMFKLQADYYAIGTGRELAVGVLWKGGTAEEAVQCAMLHNQQTWGTVQSLSFMRRM